MFCLEQACSRSTFGSVNYGVAPVEADAMSRWFNPVFNLWIFEGIVIIRICVHILHHSTPVTGRQMVSVLLSECLESMSPGRLFFNVRLPSSADTSSLGTCSYWEHCNVVVTTNSRWWLQFMSMIVIINFYVPYWLSIHLRRWMLMFDGLLIWGFPSAVEVPRALQSHPPRLSRLQHASYWPDLSDLSGLLVALPLISWDLELGELTRRMRKYQKSSWTAGYCNYNLWQVTVPRIVQCMNIKASRVGNEDRDITGLRHVRMVRTSVSWRSWS